ncbi:unnamed protein product [Dovyalis caffra]|uniref:Uncharacterized protein n=1 Tax=Dovyalis caffra TaxID=77055 RepID=A0AAV1SRU7_9ROSI|nr:unnamed protein product [Dovyalis caffra]
MKNTRKKKRFNNSKAKGNDKNKRDIGWLTMGEPWSVGAGLVCSWPMTYGSEVGYWETKSSPACHAEFGRANPLLRISE